MSDRVVEIGLLVLQVAEIAIPLGLICNGLWLLLTAAGRALQRVGGR